MNTVNINGKVYQSGRSISVSNNRVIIDGVDVTSNFKDQKQINITITGDVEQLNVDSCERIIVNGNVKEISTSSGDVDCESVLGDVSTSSGDVECGNVSGSVSTSSGDVKCENVDGNVKTNSGDIKNKK